MMTNIKRVTRFALISLTIAGVYTAPACRAGLGDRLCADELPELPERLTGVCRDDPEHIKVCLIDARFEVEVSGRPLHPYEAEEASCDGVDNDCDGAVDEGLQEGPLTDDQSGRCQGLRLSCQEGEWYDPSASTREAETCNGVDDDCDAQIDEDLDELAPLAALQEGACQGARSLCVDGAWRDPEPPQGDPPCDGVDNDCDGVIDEDATSGERCNGVDDDCDGVIDEALTEPTPLASSQAGICQGSLKQCLGGRWSDPPRSTIAGYITPDDTCDGVDTDCDGLDCPPPPPPPAPCDPQCPDVDWVTLNGGTLQMGSELSAETQPIHDVELSSFALTRAEITKRQYLACVDAGACDAPTCDVAPSDQPMGCVTWSEAYQFASWVGGRLPSEAEWAWAARGAAGRLYPWGSAEPSCEYAYMSGCGAPSRVCALSAGHTPEGVCDLAGSVSEWVMDEWHDNYLGAPTDGGPWCDRGCSPDDPTFKVIRGGSWQEGVEGQRASHRSFVSPALRLDSLGFRVARDLSTSKMLRDESP